MHLLFRIERSWSFPARLDVIGEHLGRPAQVKRKTQAAWRFVATAVRCSESGTLHLVLKEAAEPYPRSRVYSLAASFHPPKPQKRLASVYVYWEGCLIPLGSPLSFRNELAAWVCPTIRPDTNGIIA